jgi:hypothetical protein
MRQRRAGRDAAIAGPEPAAARAVGTGSPGNRVAVRVAASFGHPGAPNVVRRYITHRAGGNTLHNYTPAGKDLKGAKKGLSTMRDPTHFAKAFGQTPRKAQMVETASLGDGLEAIPNGTGPDDSHVSIVPKNDLNDAKLKAWAATKQSGGGAASGDHEYSRAVMAARTGEWQPDGG